MNRLFMLGLVLLLVGCGSDSATKADRTDSTSPSTIEPDGETVETNTSTPKPEEPVVETNTSTPTPNEPNVDTNVSTSKTFSDVYTTLQDRCLTCHGSSGGFTLGRIGKPLPNASAYNNILVFIEDTPERSFLLLKATNKVQHRGGGVISASASSYDYSLISAWIKAGSPFDGESFELTSSEDMQTGNPGYDLPTAGILKFTRNHKGGFAPVQGQACITCHQEEEYEDLVGFGGTLFSYIKTPNAYYYQDLSTYGVNLVGEEGSNVTAKAKIQSSEIGHNNFYILSENLSFGTNENFTVYIKDVDNIVVNQSGENTHNMSTHRNCNSCHTQTGKNSAPGRVLVPLSNIK